MEPMTISSKELTEKIANCMLEKQGEDIVALNLEGLSSICDAFVICTGTVDVHVKAIVDHIMKTLDDESRIRAKHVEGYTGLNWVLIDYADVIIHVFQPQSREFYRLERLWGDAERTVFNDPLTI